jgi:hypothetical protein
MNTGGIVLTSMPKAGTHLMLHILQQATGRRGRTFKKCENISEVSSHEALLYGHARVGQLLGIDHDKWRLIALIRDPRDIVLSMLDYLPTTEKSTHKETYSQIAHLSRDEQLMAIIDGVGHCAPITSHCAGWVEWRNSGGIIVRYEEILDGSAFGAIADHIGVDRRRLADSGSANIGAWARGGPNTLNKGQAWRWVGEMSPRVLTHFYKAAPDLLERVGYSKDMPRSLRSLGTIV